jgi:WD40 repeat protein
MGIQVGEGNTQIIYAYSRLTWSDGVAPPPLASVSGAVESPYRGLGAFEERDAAFFFGREEAATQVLERMSGLAGGRGLLVVSGASGAGKSSLLRAGVLPRLRGAGLAVAPGAASWRCLVLTPGRAPLDELAVRVALLAGTDAATVRRELETNPARFALTVRQAALAPPPAAGEAGGLMAPQAPEEQRLLLIVDQFEQVFTQCADEGERQAFITALSSAAGTGHEPCTKPAALVVLGVRADFEARCAGYPELAGAIQYRYLVTPMTGRQLRLAITGPAKAAGAYVDDDLVDVLLGEVLARQPGGAGPGVLPLLSHALDQAWRSRTGEALTLADYERTGGIEAAVATSAQRAYDQLSPGQQEAARQVFTRLTATSPDGVDTADRSTRAELTEGRSPAETADVEAVLEAFAAERLLTLAADSVEISHEALLTAWPLLRDTWLTETHADRITRTRLRSVAAEWDARSRDQSYLYRGTLLQAAAETAGRIAADPRRYLPLGQVAQRFLAASQEHQQAERQARRRRTRRRRAGLALTCALALVAAGAGAYSAREQQDAAQRAAVNYSMRLADDAQALRASDPGLAAQFAVAAYRSSPTGPATDQLYDSLDTPLDAVLGETDNYVARIATEADGPLAAAVGQHGTLRIWDLSHPSSPVLDATVGSVSGGIALSPNGHLLAALCPPRQGGLCLWSLANPRHPVIAGHWVGSGQQKVTVDSMAISPDGELLAAAFGQGLTEVWSISNPAQPRLVTSLPDPTRRTDGSSLAAVAFAPHGHVLAQTILGGSTTLWNLARSARPAQLATIKTGYASIAFDPAGPFLAAVGDTSIGLWQVNNLRRPVPFRLSNNSYSESDNSASEDETAVTFTRDGRYLAYAGQDLGDTNGQLCTTSLATANLYFTGLISSSCTSVGFLAEAMASGPGDALLTGGSGGVVRLWQSPVPQADSIEPVPGIAPAISPDGHLMAATTYTGPGTFVVGIWDISHPGHPVLDATAGQSTPIQFLGPSTLLTGASGEATQLWNLRDPRKPVVVASLGTAVTAPGGLFGGTVWAEPDSHLVAVEGEDERLHLWRITSPPGATQVSIIPGATDGVGLLANGDTAFTLTQHGIQWWDIRDPAHPTRGSFSPLPGGTLNNAITAGNLLAATTTAAGNGTRDLLLFDVAAGRVRSGSVLSAEAGANLDIGSDSHLLAADGADDDSVMLWNISDPAHPHLLADTPAAPGIQGIELGPHDNVMAVGYRTAVQLWDISDPSAPVPGGTITRDFDGDADSAEFVSYQVITSATFVPDTATLAVESQSDSSVFFIDADQSALAGQLCQYAGAPMSAAQWNTYAPGVPYQQPCS